MTEAKIERRALIKTAAVAALAGAAMQASAQAPDVVGQEYWTQKGNVKLNLWRKRLNDGKADKPVIFFVHGSSFSEIGRAHV